MDPPHLSVVQSCSLQILVSPRINQGTHGRQNNSLGGERTPKAILPQTPGPGSRLLCHGGLSHGPPPRVGQLEKWVWTPRFFGAARKEAGEGLWRQTTESEGIATAREKSHQSPRGKEGSEAPPFAGLLPAPPSLAPLSVDKAVAAPAWPPVCVSVPPLRLPLPSSSVSLPPSGSPFASLLLFLSPDA